MEVIYLEYSIAHCKMQYICNAFEMHNIKIQLYKIVLRGDCMKKFKIPSVPPTTNKCIRFPNDTIEEVEKAIEGKNCTFTAFVVEAVRVALENLEEEEL